MTDPIQFPSRITTATEARALIDALFPLETNRRMYGSVYYEADRLLELVKDQTHPLYAANYLLERRLYRFLDWHTTAKIYKRPAAILNSELPPRFLKLSQCLAKKQVAKA